MTRYSGGGIKLPFLQKSERRKLSIAMCIPRQALVLDELKHRGVDGHAEGLPPELGAEAQLNIASRVPAGYTFE